MALTEKWSKSSFSGMAGCVEVAWRKSSFSANGPNCVEVAFVDDGHHAVHVRDSKLGDASPVLRYTAAEWEAFIDGALMGEFEIPTSAPAAV